MGATVMFMISKTITLQTQQKARVNLWDENASDLIRAKQGHLWLIQVLQQSGRSLNLKNLTRAERAKRHQ